MCTYNASATRAHTSVLIINIYDRIAWETPPFYSIWNIRHIRSLWLLLFEYRVAWIRSCDDARCLVWWVQKKGRRWQVPLLIKFHPRESICMLQKNHQMGKANETSVDPKVENWIYKLSKSVQIVINPHGFHKFLGFQESLSFGKWLDAVRFKKSHFALWRRASRILQYIYDQFIRKRWKIIPKKNECWKWPNVQSCAECAAQRCRCCRRRHRRMPNKENSILKCWAKKLFRKWMVRFCSFLVCHLQLCLALGRAKGLWMIACIVNGVDRTGNGSACAILFNGVGENYQPRQWWWFHLSLSFFFIKFLIAQRTSSHAHALCFSICCCCCCCVWAWLCN